MATKFWTVAAFLAALSLASAESFWDGGAAAQRGDATFESGFYVASNSFPVNTEVIVQNLETGKTVTAIVMSRIDGQGDLLVLLSPKVAEAIGISQGQVAPVRVTIKSTALAQSRMKAGDLAYSQDPDINPAAGLGKGSTSVAQVPQPKTAEPETGIKTPEKPAETPATEPAVKTPVQPETKTAPATEEKPDESLLKKLATRNPQKQLFFPPREDEKFAYKPPTEPPKETVAAETPKENVPPQVETLARPETKPRTESKIATALPKEPAPAEAAKGTPAVTPTPESAPVPDKPSVASLPSSAPALRKPLSTDMPLAKPPAELVPTVEDRLAPASGPLKKEAVALGAMHEPTQPSEEKTEEPKPAETKAAEAAPLTRELSSSVPVPPGLEKVALGSLHEPLQPSAPEPLTRELSASVPVPPSREELALGPIAEPEQPAEEKLAEAAPLTKELSSPVPTPPEGKTPEALAAAEPAAPEAEKVAEAAPLTKELSSPTPTPAETPKKETVATREPAVPPQKAATEKVAEAPKTEAPKTETPKTETPKTAVSVALVPAEKQPSKAASGSKSTDKTAAPSPLSKADFFLQLGAYANERQAKSVASSLPASYPVNIVGPESPSKPIFRIVLGPLNKAESGTLLYWFRDRGFPDAFVKTSR